MSKKIRILTILAAFALVTAIIGTAAYFTGSDAKVNTFTVGKILIQLSEPSWEAEEATDIEPGKNLPKDPLITNTGEDSAFIFMTVDIPKKDIYTYNPSTLQRNAKAVTELFTMKDIDSSWSLVEKDTSDEEFNRYIYVYGTNSKCTGLAKGQSTPPLFESVDYCYAVEGQELDTDLHNIEVNAYGIQESDLGDNSNDKTSPSEVWNILKGQL